MALIKDKMMEIQNTGMTTQEFKDIVDKNHTIKTLKFVGTPVGEFIKRTWVAVDIIDKRWYSELSTDLQISVAIVLVLIERVDDIEDVSSVENALKMIDFCTFSKMDILINSIVQGN